jgi:hypothetical protein
MMFRTGDRVRYLPDGNLEFLGRLDRQLKLRGFRIEPEEIEAVLMRESRLREALVVLREDSPGDKRLVAYIVTEAAAPTSAELRAMLKSKLPDYMLPVVFVPLQALPLTANGKIDRDALPRPAPTAEEPTRGQAPPRDDVESTLCRLWGEFLGITQIGIDDNFFDAGGHSLMAARLFARQDQIFGRRLPLATLFVAPTVRELARFYRDGAEPAMGAALVPITTGGALPTLFAVPGVDGNVLGFATLARQLGSEQTFFGLQSIGVDGAREPLENLGEMAAQYLREVRRVQPRGPYYLLGACFGAVVAFEMTRQLLAAREQVAFLGLLDPSPLQGHDSDRIALRLPPWLKRGIAFGKFVAGRAQLYWDQMQPLGFRQRAQFVHGKFRLVGKVIDTGDVLRGDRREFNEGRVRGANLRALLAYKHEPVKGGSVTIEIFGTARDRGNTARGARVDWSALTGGYTPYHRVPGKDSGDMLQGDNAKALATLLSARLRHAMRAGIDRFDSV